MWLCRHSAGMHTSGYFQWYLLQAIAVFSEAELGKQRLADCAFRSGAYQEDLTGYMGK